MSVKLFRTDNEITELSGKKFAVGDFDNNEWISEENLKAELSTSATATTQTELDAIIDASDKMDLVVSLNFDDTNQKSFDFSAMSTNARIKIIAVGRNNLSDFSILTIEAGSAANLHFSWINQLADQLIVRFNHSETLNVMASQIYETESLGTGRFNVQNCYINTLKVNSASQIHVISNCWIGSATVLNTSGGETRFNKCTVQYIGGNTNAIVKGSDCIILSGAGTVVFNTKSVDLSTSGPVVSEGFSFNAASTLNKTAL